MGVLTAGVAVDQLPAQGDAGAVLVLAEVEAAEPVEHLQVGHQQLLTGQHRPLLVRVVGQEVALVEGGRPLVLGDGLGVAAEHVQRVGPEGARPALLLAVRGDLERAVEEPQGRLVVGGVEGGEPGVDEHVRVVGVGPGPTLERRSCQRRFPQEGVVSSQLDEGVRVLGVDGGCPLQLVDDLERLVGAHRQGRQAHPRGDPFRVQRQRLQKALLGLLQAV